MAESLRAEARRRGVTVSRVRSDRATTRGITPSVARGKPRRGELSLTETRLGFLPARSPQPLRYRQWWHRLDGSIAATVDTSTNPKARPGDLAWPDIRYASIVLVLQAITVRR